MDQKEMKTNSAAGAPAPFKAIVEALLFAAGDEGLSLAQIAAVLDIGEPEAKAVMAALQEDCRRCQNGRTMARLSGKLTCFSENWRKI